MKSSPKISVVINNYNYGRFLQESIESCLQQTYLPHEIIVVDDGSTDESREILASYADTPLVRIILKENGGQESALQRGFDEVTGDWVLGLDSDDFYFPDCLGEIARQVDDRVSWIYFQALLLDKKRKVISIFPAPWIRMLEGNLKEDWLLKKASPTFPSQSFNCFSVNLIRNYPVSPNPLVKMSDALPTDNYLTVLAALQGRVIAIPKALGCYRKHGGGDWTLRQQSLPGLHSMVRSGCIREEWLRKLIKKETGIQLEGPIFYTRHFSYWETRYRSLLLDPESHPIRKDRMPGFLKAIFLQLWSDRSLSIQRRTTKSLKWIMMGLFPFWANAFLSIKPWRIVSSLKAPRNKVIPEIKRKAKIETGNLPSLRT